MPSPSASMTAMRTSPLAGIALPGRFGAGIGAPGVTLSIRRDLSVVAVVMREGMVEAASSLLRAQYGLSVPAPGRSATGSGLVLYWNGSDRYYALAQGRAEADLYRELKERLQGVASCSDQSHGRVIIAVEGSYVRRLLAKGTAVDLHPRVFGPGQCAVTQMTHVDVHLAQSGPDAFEISVPRSFADYFWEWLVTQARELGYAVR